MGVAGTDQASSGYGLRLVRHVVQCQSVCGVILVASVHIMSVSRQGVAKMSNREIYKYMESRGSYPRIDFYNQ